MTSWSTGGLWTDALNYIDYTDSDDNFFEGSLNIPSFDFSSYPQQNDDVNFNSLSASGWGNIGGNLSLGNNLTFGTWTLNAGTAWSEAYPGATLNYFDNGDGSSNITLAGNSHQANWSWSQNSSAVAKEQMRLDSANNVLYLEDPVTGNILGIDDSNLQFVIKIHNGVSADAGFFSIGYYGGYYGDETSYGGIDLSSSGLALGGVVLSSPGDGGIAFVDASNSIVFDPDLETLIFSNGFTLNGNLSAPLFVLGDLGFAIGQNTTANGARSLALGANAHAPGAAALALSGGNASGDLTLAMGNNSLAAGGGALAMAGGNATGAESLAMSGNATGPASLAVGLGTQAQNWAITYL